MNRTLNSSSKESSIPSRIQQVPPQSSDVRQPWSALQLQLAPPRLLPGRRVGISSNPSPSPLPRHSHSLTATATEAGEFLVFGGLMQASSRNDVYSFSSSDSSMTLLQTAGDAPSRRVDHGSVLVNKVMVVWGGDTRKYNEADGYLDGGLYMLNLSKGMGYSVCLTTEPFHSHK